ncbi:hypothetical protein BpHYR1_006975 [Brachionus plicatilis]|uniref:Uncharacterized protein n=1 Tax=Brachionus plicatilis TaxID=10195 RepID=A0A3M7RMY3_BRAPC|nr:hypothetical protein BpHYR1_006975 [Brachionus plicatilis]
MIYGNCEISGEERFFRIGGKTENSEKIPFFYHFLPKYRSIDETVRFQNIYIFISRFAEIQIVLKRKWKFGLIFENSGILRTGLSSEDCIEKRTFLIVPLNKSDLDEFFGLRERYVKEELSHIMIYRLNLEILRHFKKINF